MNAEHEPTDMHAEEIASRVAMEDGDDVPQLTVSYDRPSALSLGLCDTEAVLSAEQIEKLDRDLEILSRQAHRY